MASPDYRREPYEADEHEVSEHCQGVNIVSPDHEDYDLATRQRDQLFKPQEPVQQTSGAMVELPTDSFDQSFLEHKMYNQSQKFSRPLEAMDDICQGFSYKRPDVSAQAQQLKRHLSQTPIWQNQDAQPSFPEPSLDPRSPSMAQQSSSTSTELIPLHLSGISGKDHFRKTGASPKETFQSHIVQGDRDSNHSPPLVLVDVQQSKSMLPPDSIPKRKPPFPLTDQTPSLTDRKSQEKPSTSAYGDAITERLRHHKSSTQPVTDEQQRPTNAPQKTLPISPVPWIGKSQLVRGHHNVNRQPAGTPSSQTRHVSGATGRVTPVGDLLFSMAEVLASSSPIASEGSRCSKRLERRCRDMNRPIRIAPTIRPVIEPGESLRPISRSSGISNISKKRSASKYPRQNTHVYVDKRHQPSREVPATLIGDKQCTAVHQIVEQGALSKPATSYMQPAQEFGDQLARSWNKYLQQHRAEMGDITARYEKKIRHMTKVIEAKTSELEDKNSELFRAHTDKENLQAENASLDDQIKEMEACEEASAAKVRKLEDKFRMYKEHLNTAIEEQQSLFNKSQKACKDATEEIQKQAVSHRASVEEAQKAVEINRKLIMDKFTAEISQSKQQAQQVHGMLQELKIQLQQKQRELESERERSKEMAKQMEQQQKSEVTLCAIAEQNKALMELLTEQSQQVIARISVTGQEQNTRIDAVVERLGLLDNPRPDDADLIGALQMDVTKRLEEKVDGLCNAQFDNKIARERSEATLADNLAEFWQHLDSQQDKQNHELAQKEAQNLLLRRLLEEKEKENDQLQEEVATLDDRHDKDRDRVEELTRIKEQLETDMEQRCDLAELRSTQAEASRLQDQLLSQEQKISELENKLRDQEKMRAEDAENHARETETVQKTLTQRESVSQQIIDGAVLAATEGLQKDMKKQDAEGKIKLNRLEVEKSELTKRLNEMRSNANDKEKAHNDAIKSWQSQLTAAQEQHAALAEELARNQLALESKHTQGTCELQEQIEALKSQLAAALGRCAQERSASLAARSNETCNAYNSVKALAGERGLGPRNPLRSSSNKHNEPSTDISTRGATSVVPDAKDMGVVGDKPRAAQDGVAARILEDDESNSPPSSFDPEENRGSLADSQGSLQTLDCFSQFESRKVTVCSPADFIVPMPPSIDEERARRRDSNLPRSILKRVTRSSSQLGDLHFPESQSINMTQQEQSSASGDKASRRRPAQGRFSLMIIGKARNSLQESFQGISNTATKRKLEEDLTRDTASFANNVQQGQHRAKRSQRVQVNDTTNEQHSLNISEKASKNRQTRNGNIRKTYGSQHKSNPAKPENSTEPCIAYSAMFGRSQDSLLLSPQRQHREDTLLPLRGPARCFESQ